VDCPGNKNRKHKKKVDFQRDRSSPQEGWRGRKRKGKLFFHLEGGFPLKGNLLFLLEKKCDKIKPQKGEVHLREKEFSLLESLFSLTKDKEKKPGRIWGKKDRKILPMTLTSEDSIGKEKKETVASRPSENPQESAISKRKEIRKGGGVAARGVPPLREGSVT